MKKQDITGERLYTMTQTANILNVSVDTVRRLIYGKYIKAVKIFDMPRIKSTEIQRFIKSLEDYR